MSPERLSRRNGRTRRNLAAYAVLSEARGLLRISALGVFTNHPVSEKPQDTLLLPVCAYASIIHGKRDFVKS